MPLSGDPLALATTDAQGRFTLRHVSRQARLRVTAGNYRPTEVQLTGELLGVALSPIPVRGVVTSTLTGSGLRATIAGAGTGATAAAADGSFRVYGLGPGDRLTVTAPGYKPASVTIGGSREVRVALAAEEATRIEQVNQWLRAGKLAPVWRVGCQKRVSPHAARSYSWIRPPRTSRRWICLAAGGSAMPWRADRSGADRSRLRWGRWRL